ncbi:MAG: glutamate ligase domain-containing protein, partial [Planctomycetota bacterium]
HLPAPLPGEHQALNCGLALAAIDALKGAGFSFPEVPLHEGLAATSTPGRMELVWKQPRILIDGAHNPAAISALMRCVGAYVPYDSMICIFGCCEDKDIPAMLDRLALGGDKVIFTRARSTPRAAEPEELHRQFSERCGKMSQVAATLPQALDLATRAVGRDDLICITGSFYLVGEARKHLEQVARKRQQEAAPV